MFHGAFYGYKHATTQALASWQRVYNGKLSTMLTDTFSSDIFFKILSNKMANVVNQLDGFRHDSGDPFKYTDNVLRFLECSNIDPLSKKIVFSDSLTPEKAVEINNYCKDKINCSFGIGTNLSNDVGVKPLNIVIKMNNYLPNGKNDSKIPTVKLSDVAGKNTGTPEAIKQCKEELWI